MIFSFNVFNNDNKFIPSVTTDGIGIAQACLKILPDTAQQYISGFMAVLIIDLFEIIEINKIEGNLVAVALSAKECLGETIVHRGSIESSGQCVVLRTVGEGINMRT